MGLPGPRQVNKDAFTKMTPAKRVALLGFHLESNAFAPVSTEADFRRLCYLEGDAILAEARQPAPPCRRK